MLKRRRLPADEVTATALLTLLATSPSNTRRTPYLVSKHLIAFCLRETLSGAQPFLGVLNSILTEEELVVREQSWCSKHAS